MFRNSQLRFSEILNSDFQSQFRIGPRGYTQHSKLRKIATPSDSQLRFSEILNSDFQY